VFERENEIKNAPRMRRLLINVLLIRDGSKSRRFISSSSVLLSGDKVFFFFVSLVYIIYPLVRNRRQNDSGWFCVTKKGKTLWHDKTGKNTLNIIFASFAVGKISYDYSNILCSAQS